VKTLTGKYLTIAVELTDRIEVVKERIYGLEGIPSDQQRLLYNSQVMENEMSLADYQVTFGAVLHLALRLRG
jgi:ubiquitin